MGRVSSSKTKQESVQLEDMAVDVNGGTYLNHKYNHRVNTILPSNTVHSGENNNQCLTSLARGTVT